MKWRELWGGGAENLALREAIGPAHILYPDLRRELRDADPAPAPDVAAEDLLLERAVERGEVEAGNPAIPVIAPCLLGGLRFQPFFADRFAGPESLVGYLKAIIFRAFRLT